MKHVIISLESGKIESVGPLLLIKANPIQSEDMSGKKLPETYHKESPNTKNFVFKITVDLIDAFIKALDDSKADKNFWEPKMDDYVLDKIIDFDGKEISAYKHHSFILNQYPTPQEVIPNQNEHLKKPKIMNINDALDSCLSNMKASTDFNDNATVSSIKDLLSCVIENPAELINFANEENLSIVLSSVLTCQFPLDYPTYKDINVRNLVFATSYYLYMHQLETSRFYDKDWPAFITLLHCGRNEFAKFIIDTDPFAPERINEIAGRPIDNQRSLNAAKGLELNMMLTAKRKGVWTDELTDWYDELCDDKYELLENDPFRKEAIPLYQVITNNLKENDVTFVNIK